MAGINTSNNTPYLGSARNVKCCLGSTQMFLSDGVLICDLLELWVLETDDLDCVVSSSDDEMQ